MAIIRTLSPQLTNLIAAGEVVERPASAAKELIENALDAGCSRITVEIKNGGISYLRVTDDGCGMAPDDARTAFLRHATSKISRESDLAAIGTLGFRGEALAAISAVSRVDLFTRLKGSPAGTHISLEGGQETLCEETGCPEGTTIVVRDLFYNVPARMKFLKKDTTESAYVESAVIQAALACPHVSFCLIKDGRETLFTKGDDNLRSAVYAAYGRELAQGLLESAGGFQEVVVNGLVSPPGLSRGNRNLQMFFVNGRPVRSKLLCAALEEAYQGKLMTGRWPVCFLNIRLSLSAVDVNVHPAKLEVKFSREKEVFSAVYHTVMAALDEQTPQPGAVPAVKPAPKEEKPGAPWPITVQRTPAGLTFPETHRSGAFSIAASKPIVYETRPRQGGYEKISAACKPPDAPPAPAPEEYRTSGTGRTAAWEETGAFPAPDGMERLSEECPEGRYLGEMFRTYLLVEETDGLWIIDKHAAHERMIYDRLRGNAGEVEGQLLLVPQPVPLSREEKDICLSHLPLFQKAGFDLEDMGTPDLVVRQAPGYLDMQDIPYVISDMAAKLQLKRAPDSELFDELLKSIACKAAVKGGDAGDWEEERQFALAVLKNPNVRRCPHGRPAAVCVTRRQLEKMFKRVT